MGWVGSGGFRLPGRTVDGSNPRCCGTDYLETGCRFDGFDPGSKQQHLRVIDAFRAAAKCRALFRAVFDTSKTGSGGVE